jgi:formate hydrogenlyase subunit 6/NADH:ubiquinone oxidoreductase subunit I
MQTGPQVESGFDIALTEVCEAAEHYFVAEAGSESGLKVLQQLPHETASPTEIEKAASLVKQAGEQMGRTLDTEGLKELLYRNTENSRWEEVANRCLTCANCTMVCPTCFCSRVEDVTDLDGASAERWRKWDSCFTVEYSYIKGGSVRPSVHSRYRQWLTHKLAAWYDQFGTSGCVGCGRCITWCPVGIDLTEEARAIRQSELSR